MLPTVYFYEPPDQKKVGGLDAAIQELGRALRASGTVVRINEPLPPGAGAGDVVHFHGLWEWGHLGIARECARLGVPFVVSPHGMLEPWAWKHKWWKKRPYFALFERGRLRRARALLATSESEAAQLRGFFPRQRVAVIPLGLTGTARPSYAPARSSLGWREDEWVLLFLSRIHPKKGLDILLRSLVEVGQSVPANARLVIVGDGDPAYLGSLRQYCSSHSEQLPRIDWVGAIWGEERWRYFQGADLFCLTTHSENFGLAILESCQVGTPVLTTDTTPWAQDLSSGRGYITKPTVPSVAASLRGIFQEGPVSEDKRASLADWAWSKFAWPTLVADYLSLYETLRSEKQGRHAGSNPATGNSSE